MPISVSCPSCSAGFKVKDEYAGKRGKCPKCGEPITIPAVVDTVLMPPPPKAAAPVTARPGVANKPKPAPVDDEAEDAPKPKRRRDEDDEDDKPPVSPKRKRGAEDEEVDKPVSPKRKRGASDEDAAPKKRRRRDDDDEPKKKGKALPVILGIVGGVLLLCGGGCAGVWFGVIAPAAEKAKNDLNAMASDMKSRAGETEPGGNPTAATVLTPDELADNFVTYREKVVTVRGAAEFVGGQGKKGSIILRGGAMKTQIVCNFEDTGNNAPPKTGDVVEVRGLVEPVSNVAQVRLKDCVLMNGKPAGPNPPLPNNPAPNPVGGTPLTVEALVKDASKLDGKTVVVTAKVAAVETEIDPPTVFLQGQGMSKIECNPSVKGWGKLPTAGETVTIRGTLAVYDMNDGTKSYSLNQSQIVAGNPAK